MASAFDTTQYPALSQLLSTPYPAQAPQSRRNPLVAGVSSGIDTLQALGGAAIGAAGNLVGIDAVKQLGEGIARSNFAEAQKNGRPDLESIPTDDVTKLPSWLAYQTAKQIPNIAAILAASKLPGIRSVGNALPQEALALGTAAPKWIGGAGVIGRAATAEEMAVGAQYARNVASAAAASYPLAVGSLYNEAMERGDPTPGDALKAAAMGVPYAALEAFQPRQLENMIVKGMKGSLPKRIATGMAAGAALEAPVEAAQTAMEMSFRPDLPLKDKMANIVEAAVTGGAVGGVLGGMGGIRRLKTTEPSQVTQDDLAQTIDEALNGQAAQPTLPGVPLPAAETQVFDTQSRELRPLANVSDDELAQGLAAAQQRMAGANSPEWAGMFGEANPDDSLVVQQIRQELARRQQPEAQVDQGPSLFDRAGIPLSEQRAPNFLQPSEMEANNAQKSEAMAFASGVMGTPRTTWAKNLVGGITAEDTPVSVTRKLVEAITAMNDAGIDLPKDAIAIGAKIGLFNPDGTQRDLAAEIAAAEKQADALSSRARQSGLAQDLAKYNEYRRTTLADLQRTASLLSEATKVEPTPPNAAENWQNAFEEAAIRNPPRPVTPQLAPTMEQDTPASSERDLFAWGGINPTYADAWNETFGDAPAAPDLSSKKAQTLVKELNQIQQRAKDGPAAADYNKLFGTKEGPGLPAPEDALRAQQIRAELDRRAAATPEKAAPEQLKLFGRNAPDVARFTPTQNKVLEWAGTKSAAAQDFAAKLQGDDIVVATRAIKGEIDRYRNKGKPLPKYLANMGANAGLIDEQGNARDLRAELKAAQARSKQLWQDARSTGVGVAQAQAYQNTTVKQLEEAVGRVERALRPTPQSTTGVEQSNAKMRVLDLVAEIKLQEIINNQEIADDLRNAASEALAMSQSPGAMNASDLADEVIAEYGVRYTGEYGFSAKPASEARPPMREDEFNAALEQILSKLPQQARDSIVVVPNYQGLPGHIDRAAKKYGLTVENVEGVTYGDKVYIVRDRVSSRANLEELVTHEVFGHGGVRALFGDQRQAVMSGAYKSAGGTGALRAIARSFGVESQLNQYLPDRDLTVEEEAAVTEELLAQVASSKQSKFKMALLSWVSRLKAGLINVLRDMGLNRFADRLNQFDAADLAFTITQMRQAVMEGRSFDGSDAAFKFATPQGMVDSAKNVMKTVANFEQFRNTSVWQELGLAANKLHLYTSTLGHIVEYFGDLFRNPDGSNALEGITKTYRSRGVAEQRFAHLGAKTHNAYLSVRQSSPNDVVKLRELMGMTGYEIDPRKTWDEHPWLHGAANSDVLRKKVAQANSMYRSIAQSHGIAVQKAQQENKAAPPTALSVYNDFIAMNEMQRYAQQALMLYKIIMDDAEVSQAKKDEMRDPMIDFLGKAETYDNAKASRDYWQKTANDLMTFAKGYVEEQRGIAALSEAQRKDKIVASTSAIWARVLDMTREQEAMAKAPYFHIGRFGNYVLTFKVKKLESGQADPAALERIAEAFDKAGIKNIVIPTDNTRPNVFIRFENKPTLAEGVRVATELQKLGLTSDMEHYDRAQDTARISYDESPTWVKSMLDKVRATYFGANFADNPTLKPVVDQVNREIQQHHTQFFLDLLPEHHIAKVLVHRNFVSGFSDDMVRAYVFRVQIGGRALANLHASRMMSDASKKLIEFSNNANKSGDVDKGLLTQNVVAEIFKREADRADIPRNSFIDMWRAFNHVYFLGLSPSYAMINMTQVPVLLWPELAKRFGYVNSAKAIGKATPIAFKIMKATLAEGAKLGWRNLPDASISREVLNAAGVKGAVADFVLRVVNSGIIDIGSQSRELGRVSEGKQDSKLEDALRWGSAFGYYTEMLSRLIAALSAREVHGGNSDEMFDYVDETVRQSMFSFEAHNQGRATGRMGLAGPLTPILTSMQQYTYQLTEKLFREFNTAFIDSAKTEDQKSAARKFLAAHLAAIVTLTGTLGMPMASIFATVFDALYNGTVGDDDDEPMDIQLAWKNYLADIFGKETAQVIANGVPRAFGAGIDISQRAGEQNLIPYLHSFSKLLTDKRKWEDATKDWALNTFGTPVAMISNFVSGAGKVMAGDPIEGMKTMVPVALKGPFEAYKLYNDGYTDKMGNGHPVSPGGTDVLFQALGFNPASKANLAERRYAESALKGQMYAKARQIRKDLVVAIEKGDMESARDYMARAMEFDEKNPNFAILPGLKSVLRERARARNKAEVYGTPTGGDPDLAGAIRF